MRGVVKCILANIPDDNIIQNLPIDPCKPGDPGNPLSPGIPKPGGPGSPKYKRSNFLCAIIHTIYN